MKLNHEKNNGKGGLRTPDLTVISRALYQAKPLSQGGKFNQIKSTILKNLF